MTGKSRIEHYVTIPDDDDYLFGYGACGDDDDGDPGDDPDLDFGSPWISEESLRELAIARSEYAPGPGSEWVTPAHFNCALRERD